MDNYWGYSIRVTDMKEGRIIIEIETTTIDYMDRKISFKKYSKNNLQ